MLGRHTATTESLIDRAMSMSSISRARLGDERAAALVAELRALFAELAPAGELEEVLEWSALIATRPPE